MVSPGITMIQPKRRVVQRLRNSPDKKKEAFSFPRALHCPLSKCTPLSPSPLLPCHLDYCQHLHLALSRIRELVKLAVVQLSLSWGTWPTGNHSSSSPAHEGFALSSFFPLNPSHPLFLIGYRITRWITRRSSHRVRAMKSPPLQLEIPLMKRPRWETQNCLVC